ncbi:unnamed protein product [Camellia sinensis]
MTMSLIQLFMMMMRIHLMMSTHLGFLRSTSCLTLTMIMNSQAAAVIILTMESCFLMTTNPLLG